jgi:hypothetical protein
MSTVRGTSWGTGVGDRRGGEIGSALARTYAATGAKVVELIFGPATT